MFGLLHDGVRNYSINVTLNLIHKSHFKKNIYLISTHNFIP